MSSAATAFGWDLYQALSPSLALQPTGAFISPLSAWFALVLALAGAGPLSSTQREMWGALNPGAAALQASGLAPQELAFNARAASLQRDLLAQAQAAGVSNGTRLTIANALWTKQLAVRPAYAQAMRQLYGAEVAAVNTSAPINAWAANATNGLITRVVPDGLAFNFIITNAVYFKGAWAYAFDTDATTPQAFTVPTGKNSSKVVQTPIMFKSFKPRDMRPGERPVAYSAVPGLYRAVRLPYRGSNLSAIAVLPDQARFGLDADAAALAIPPARLLNASGWRSVGALPGLQLSLPKFEVRVDQLSLEPALRKLGVAAAFEPSDANFSRISSQELFISDVLQSAVVRVDEVGTEAAAVTSVIMTTSAFQPDALPVVTFDRPFLFLIVDDSSGSVLFHGTVKDPSQGQAPRGSSSSASSPRAPAPAANQPGRSANLD